MKRDSKSKGTRYGGDSQTERGLNRKSTRKGTPNGSGLENLILVKKEEGDSKYKQNRKLQGLKMEGRTRKGKELEKKGGSK